jgi:hypothetical protein
MTLANITNASTVDLEKLPTIPSLVRSTIIATATAAILAVTCVVPAEYAVDPTGIGRVLGLTEMGEIKRDAELKKAKKADLPTSSTSPLRLASGSHIMSDAAPLGGAWSRLAQAVPAAVPAIPGQKTDTLEIVLQPNAKMELKAWMKKGDGYTFTWTASSAINFNFHGEKINARDDEYTEYKKGIAATDKGEFKAGYDGTHGWSWRNRTKQPITVKATITGTYEKFAEKK